MAARVIHFGWDDCYRIQVLRFAGYEVKDSQSLESLAADLERDDEVDAVVLSEDDWRNLPEAVAVVNRYSTAPLILFRRTQQRINESHFDRVFSCLVSPEIWLSQVGELIVASRALREESKLSSTLPRAARSEEKSTSIPSLFDRVKMRGRQGVYLAFRINFDREDADLVHLIGKHQVERGVSFATLERVPEGWRPAA